MVLLKIKSEKDRDIILNANEIRELLQLIENQETNDKYTDIGLHINGNYAELDVEIDSDGDIILEN